MPLFMACVVLFQILDERDNNNNFRPYWTSNSSNQHVRAATKLLLMASSFTFTKNNNETLNARMTSDDSLIQLSYFNPDLSASGLRAGGLNVSSELWAEICTHPEVADFIKALKEQPLFAADPNYREKVKARLEARAVSETSAASAASGGGSGGKKQPAITPARAHPAGSLAYYLAEEQQKRKGGSKKVSGRATAAAAAAAKKKAKAKPKKKAAAGGRRAQ